MATSSHLPGRGDEITWGAPGNWGDPRNECADECHCGDPVPDDIEPDYCANCGGLLEVVESEGGEP